MFGVPVRSWEEAQLWKMARSLFFILTFPQTPCLRVALPQMDWTLPHELLIKKIPYRLAYWQFDKVIFSVEFPWS